MMPVFRCTIYPATEEGHSISLINKEVSDLKVYAYHANDFRFVSREDIPGKWSVFFYPADFTFVCPTKLEDLRNKYEQFRHVGYDVYNLRVTAEVYDLAHFEQPKNRYQIMSVTCLIVNDDQVTFDKKTIQQLLTLLEQ